MGDRRCNLQAGPRALHDTGLVADARLQCEVLDQIEAQRPFALCISARAGRILQIHLKPRAITPSSAPIESSIHTRSHTRLMFIASSVL